MEQTIDPATSYAAGKGDVLRRDAATRSARLQKAVREAAHGGRANSASIGPSVSRANEAVKAARESAEAKKQTMKNGRQRGTKAGRQQRR
jgi:hypothetical protein